MSENTPEDKHRANLMALVFLLRQMAGQFIEDGKLAEARGFVDIVESLQAKTKGNVDEEESKVLESVLFELRMAVLQGKEGEAAADPGKEETTEPPPSEEKPEAETEA